MIWKSWLSTTAGANAVNLAGVAAEAITVAGEGMLQVEAVDAALESFDASASTGAVEADLSAAGDLEPVATGEGNDELVLAASGNSVKSVSTGAGDDTIEANGGVGH